MKRRRIKLLCSICGTTLDWHEDRENAGRISVQPCPACVGQLTDEQMKMYEMGRQAGLEQNIEDINYSC